MPVALEFCHTGQFLRSFREFRRKLEHRLRCFHLARKTRQERLGGTPRFPLTHQGQPIGQGVVQGHSQTLDQLPQMLKSAPPFLPDPCSQLFEFQGLRL